MIIQGKCHCGNITFALDWRSDPLSIPARVCDCTFCSKHHGVWTSNPAASLSISVVDESKVSKYRFGTGTADFHVCSRCGVTPVVTSTIDGQIYAVVNVQTFERIESKFINPSPASFDGEGTDNRLARRKRNWIADVKFVAR